MKTSSAVPLPIAEIAFGEGRLGLTLCPGKQDALLGWARDLGEDLQAIRAWGADTVVSLIEDHEFALLAVGGLGRELRALGIDWMHLPIRDTDVPDSRFEDGWFIAGRIVHARLDAGRRVLVHCRGGFGRTGTVAARVLVERGCDPRLAIHRIRAVRPGAIETGAQERYVLGLAPGSRDDDAWRGRVLGSLLAGALGDATGYLVEFDSLDEIRRQYGPQGLRISRLFLDPLYVSDDTQMSLFTLEGLQAAGATADPEALAARLRVAYLDWYETQRPGARVPAGTLAREPRLRQSRAPGLTCLSALEAGGAAPGERRNDSKGCGTVMRVAPIGWFQRWSPAEAYAIGCRASAITHGHPTAIVAGGAMAAIVRAVVGGAAIADAAREAIRLAATSADHAETVAAIDAALALAANDAPPTPEALGRLGAGWVAEEALAIGLYAALKGETLVAALEIAINHSGDSDSTASIAGQLRGAADGLRDLPYHQLRRLDVLLPMLAMVRDAVWE